MCNRYYVIMDAIRIMIVNLVVVITLCVGVGEAESLTLPSEDQMLSDGPLSAISRYIQIHGCDSPINNRTSVIHDCLKRSLHFFRKYLARLDKGKQFDICGRFADIEECLDPILETCPEFRQKYSKILTPIMDYLRCACTDDGDCMENLHCFEVEYRGILSRRCEVYYKFNIQQRTHGQCFFLQESVACKVSLVTTACDERTGDFAFNLYRFLALHETKTSQCDVTYIPPTEYNGFYYDANCPTYFIQDLASCSTNHLWNKMLPFDEDNDLVAKGKEEDIRIACSAYKSYRKCIRHPRKACKKGTSEVFNYGANLRKYALKMDYICKSDNKKEYMSSLSCYQDVLNNETLQQCDYIYKDLKPWLYSVSAVQFYCKQNSEDTRNMQMQLDRLRGCYHRVFQTRCGEDAGALMKNLIGLAFKDPAYLRYSYTPDCTLHRKTTRLKSDENEVLPPNKSPSSSKGADLKRSSSSAFIVCDFRALTLTFVLLLTSQWYDT